MSSSPQTAAGGSIQILVQETEIVQNAKGLGSISKLVQSVREISTHDLAARLRTFCTDISLVFEDLTLPISSLALEEIEVSVELTSKGEVRLVASAATEVKGGIKLTFKRQSPTAQH